MLFKEKILLSNCDSVKKRSEDEIRKRLLIGLVFGNGIVLSPNILFDNQGIQKILRQKNVIKFLNEEGRGEFIIRGVDIKNIQSASEYFDNLPGSYAVSSLKGKRKDKLSKSELFHLKEKLSNLDKLLQSIHPNFQNANIKEDSLLKEVNSRISKVYFDNTQDKFDEFKEETKHFISRSQWYNYFDKNNPNNKKIITEIIDPAYNSLFVNEGEGFMQDNVDVLMKIPEKILSAGVSYKSLRKEIELIEYPLKAFEIITTLGSTDLIKIITDEALGYIEDKTQDGSLSYFSRKNWFGLYPVLREKMGIEIK